ncbi:MAG: VTT domain-containing protein [Candidatus Micrarchaeota archaeon]
MIDFVLLSSDLIGAYGLLGLFIITFLSASLLPFPSEPILVLASTQWSFVEILLIVTVSSTIAAFINYYVGLKGLRFFLSPRDKDKEKKAHELLEKYGVWALIASPWIPFIGDLFPVVAGFLKMSWKKFFMAMLIARVIKTSAVLLFGFVLLDYFF